MANVRIRVELPARGLYTVITPGDEWGTVQTLRQAQDAVRKYMDNGVPECCIAILYGEEGTYIPAAAALEGFCDPTLDEPIWVAEWGWEEWW